VANGTAAAKYGPAETMEALQLEKSQARTVEGGKSTPASQFVPSAQPFLELWQRRGRCPLDARGAGTSVCQAPRERAAESTSKRGDHYQFVCCQPACQSSGIASSQKWHYRTGIVIVLGKSKTINCRHSVGKRLEIHSQTEQRPSPECPTLFSDGKNLTDSGNLYLIARNSSAYLVQRSTTS
jgi:hypothetical protein